MEKDTTYFVVDAYVKVVYLILSLCPISGVLCYRAYGIRKGYDSTSS